MKTNFELQYDAYDVTAASDATYKLNNDPHSNARMLNGEIASQWSQTWLLNERNYAIGGESTSALPVQQMGFYCPPANANGEFVSENKITVDFTQPHSSVGITLLFSGVLPDEFTVEWYDLDGAFLRNAIVEPESTTCIVQERVLNYGKIVITFTKGHPNIGVRVLRLTFGATFNWTQGDIISATSSQEIDMLGDTIPIGTLTVKIDDSKNLFNLGNIGGLHSILQKKQIARTIITTDGVSNLPSNSPNIWYFKEFSVDKSVVTLQFTDAIGILDTTPYGGHACGTITARSILNEIRDQSGVQIRAMPELSNMSLRGFLPDTITCRQALREVLFATDAILQMENGTDAGDGTLIVKRNKEGVGTIGRDQKFNTQMTLEEYVAGAEVEYYAYAVTGSGYEEVLSGDYAAGSYIISINEPLSNGMPLRMTITYTDGTTETRSFSSQFKMNVVLTKDAKIVISAIKHKKDTRTAYASNIPEAGQGDKVVRYKGELFTDEIAAAKAKSIVEYFSLRRTARIDRIGSKLEGSPSGLLPKKDSLGCWTVVENPMVGSGDIVMWNEKITINYTGGYLFTVEGRGDYESRGSDNYFMGVNDAQRTVPDLIDNDILI